MAKSHRFGAVLARIRRERGFATAHAFYSGQGGRKTLLLTYRSYMDLEGGKNLPKPERLEALISALGLAEGSAQARDLVEAYQESLGMKTLQRFLSAPEPSSGTYPDWDLAESALQHRLQDDAVQLSAAQWRAQAESPEAYGCFHLLVNSPGGLPIPEIARATGFAGPALKRALQRLGAAGLIEISDEKARCLLDDKAIRQPGASKEMVGVLSALRARRLDLAGKSRAIRDFGMTARLSEKNLKRFERQLEKAFDLLELYYERDASQPSAIYLVQAQVYKSFPNGEGA